MGASHATLASSNDAENEEFQLNGYTVDQRLYPGSGRMMQTFRLKSSSTQALVVCKSMSVSQEHESLVKEQQEELQKIKYCLKGQSHVAPFLHWHAGDYKPNTNLRSVYIVRPHVYTTLSDRLASRPFLDNCEKLWITHQLLDALDHMHAAGVVHGFLTTENVGLTSWNWVVLMDLASYKPRTALPENDPSSYLYYFQELNKHSAKPREKRCYLAPERFYTPSSSHDDVKELPLAPAMDIFSAGNVVLETFLNGERALDLGDLMEYRKMGEIPSKISQKLSKLESSSLRALCRHMMSIDPEERLSAREYQERLNDIMPTTFEQLYIPLFELVTSVEVTPDARMAVAASYYDKVLKASVGVNDAAGSAHFQKLLGPTMVQMMREEGSASRGDSGGTDTNDKKKVETATESSKARSEQDLLLAETEALLKKLESPSFDDEEDDHFSILSALSIPSRHHEEHPGEPPSPADASSLLIYLDLVLSTIRHVQRPLSKLVGLQLLEKLSAFSSDDVKLQRFVPTTVSLLHDENVLVRAMAVQVMTSTLTQIKTFAPSDSKIFPTFIFKRVAHLLNDASLVVRVAFATCIASLADTALLFLDISHAVRLYEAVGGNGEGTSDGALKKGGDVSTASLTPGVFTDDVANLLDDKTDTKSIDSADSNASSKKESGHSRKSSMGNASVTPATSVVGRTLITSTYTSELAMLQEIVSKWVVHIATDQSEQSSPPKQSLLRDLARLCNFFGRDGVMAFILPQILAFLNDRRDWQLRAALFQRLASVCSIIGRAATEHFVLPCLETALVDSQDIVMSQALQCLSSLVEMGLLSRSVLVTPQSVLPTTGLPGKPKRGLFEKYLPLLVYPSSSVRHCAIVFVNASCSSLGFPDAFVFLLPHLRPYLRFEPSTSHLTTIDGLEKCLITPWTGLKLDEELHRIAEESQNKQMGTQWTSVDDGLVQVQEQKEDSEPSTSLSTIAESEQKVLSASRQEGGIMNCCMMDYLRMLQRSRGANISSVHNQGAGTSPALKIEGSLKLAQHVRIPEQRASGTDTTSIPEWYASFRDFADDDQHLSETSAIRSVSSLSRVYGLSVLEGPTLADSKLAKDAVIIGQKTNSSPEDEENETDLTNDSALRSREAKLVEGANAGEWGADVLVDPSIADAVVLVTKMKGLDVPPLPPDVGVATTHGSPTVSPKKGPKGDSKATGEWRPRTDALIASSSHVHGHTGPATRLAVAPDDQYFVSASYDGTLRVWEARQVEDSDGVLVSSATYTGHLDSCEHGHPRINDVATVDNSNSVVSGASDGTLHVWKVDMVSKAPGTSGAPQASDFDRSTVSGCSTVRRLNPKEGEIHAVSHFNTPSASIIVFASQGAVHSLDLRQARQPFQLKHQPEAGYLTSMALGNDSNWMVTGTSRGYIALWDIRFQQQVKLWQHSGEGPVTRLATSFASLPRKWGDRGASVQERPFMFVACGTNECGMFDVTDGTIRECFRVVGPRSRATDSTAGRDLRPTMPVLRDVRPSSARKSLRQGDFLRNMTHNAVMGPSLNALVGNVGGSEHSYMVTGGDDGFIRYWDFATPSKCFTVSGHQGLHHRPTYERVDYDGQRLILCRHAPAPRPSEIDGSRFPRTIGRGPFRTENRHSDSISDLKLLCTPARLLSCSRDSTVKIWR